MKLKLTSRLLALLAENAAGGSPGWALAVANEYLPSDDPIRLALVRQSINEVRNKRGSVPIWLDALSRGISASDCGAHHQDLQRSPRSKTTILKAMNRMRKFRRRDPVR